MPHDHGLGYVCPYRTKAECAKATSAFKRKLKEEYDAKVAAREEGARAAREQAFLDYEERERARVAAILAEVAGEHPGV